MVQDYSHEKAVADGINVGYNVYRIETEITKEGATLKKEPGLLIPRRDKRTRQMRLAELDDDLTYTGSQLDRDVTNPSQLRLVIQTFRDRLYTEIFPGRTEVPKTLVFAKNDNHADDIVKVFREEFARGNDFCQKITLTDLWEHVKCSRRIYRVCVRVNVAGQMGRMELWAAHFLVWEGRGNVFDGRQEW